MQKRSTGEWLEGTLSWQQGHETINRSAQLVGDTLFFFAEKLRNLTMLPLGSADDGVTAFSMPTKRKFRERMVNFTMVPSVALDAVRWREALSAISQKIKMGYLEKGTRRFGVVRWRRYWFQLHCLCIGYFKTEKNAERVFRGCLSLVPECSVKAIDALTLQLNSHGGGGHSPKEWLLRATTPQEATQWLEIIRITIARKNGDVAVSCAVELASAGPENALESSAAISRGPKSHSSTRRNGGRGRGGRRIPTDSNTFMEQSYHARAVSGAAGVGAGAEGVAAGVVGAVNSIARVSPPEVCGNKQSLPSSDILTPRASRSMLRQSPLATTNDGVGGLMTVAGIVVDAKEVSVVGGTSPSGVDQSDKLISTSSKGPSEQSPAAGGQAAGVILSDWADMEDDMDEDMVAYDLRDEADSA